MSGKEYQFDSGDEGTEERREHLFRNGPCLDVTVSGLVVQAAGNELEGGGLSSSPAQALLDTGADLNAINGKLALRVGMAQVGNGYVTGMTGRVLAPIYLGRMFIPSLRRHVNGHFYGAHLRGRPYQIILGREFLMDFVFRYKGAEGRFYLRPIDYSSPSDA